MKMTVNFNNLRKQALYRYDDLCQQLNAAIITNDQWAKPNDVRHGQEINIKGYVVVDAESILETLLSLSS